MSKPRTQAINTSVAEPTARAMSVATTKTPVPIVSPMTMAIADPRPRPRTKSRRSEWSDGLLANIAESQSLLAAMKMVNDPPGGYGWVVVPLQRLPTPRPVTHFQGKSQSPKKCREEHKVRVTVKRAKHSERREVIPPTEGL